MAALPQYPLIYHPIQPPEDLLLAAMPLLVLAELAEMEEWAETPQAESMAAWASL
jgi:hypothetical protein